jgi:hypothetical protein
MIAVTMTDAKNAVKDLLLLIVLPAEIKSASENI